MQFIKAYLFITLSKTWVSCTISSLTYMDPLNLKPFKPLPGEDPCHSLYWYPKSVPEYCHILKPAPPFPPLLPPPPQPIPFPMPPMAPGLAMPPPLPMPMIPPPIPMVPAPMPLPFGIPLAPTNPMLPIAGAPIIPYPNTFQQHRPQQQIGMVPGVPGLVTEDGGINILPFSDAYADLLQKHKQKLIIKKLQRVLDRYYPNRRRRHRRRY